ncbi:hypothetical protein BDA96_07G109700 [Sorghum bicolor]|uniref:Uncharacterized protein n=1 Tax=Sorghum bicolor TaxID=4558 RepID=A0A921QKH9_SORBI|nr:hypothetical protein BDA96_07G109700 [Sorghum bicolor]
MRSKKWAGPAHQVAHVPLPLLAWLIPMGISSSGAPRSPPLIHLRSSLRHSTSLCGSASIYSRRRALPDRAAGGGEKAESSRRRRGDSGILRTGIRIDEETAESRGHEHVHKVTRCRLTPKASLERPDA